IVGMSLLARAFDQKRDHLVRVHVGRGAAPGLKNIDDELRVIVSPRKQFGGGLDRPGLGWRKLAQLLVGFRRGGFYESERLQKRSWKPQTADRKILHRALGLRS